MKVTTRYPGSIGEVIQGKSNGVDILYSCPINLYSEVTISTEESGEEQEGYSKAYRFMKNILTEWGYTNLNPKIDIKSAIPKGKGFASSTADLCATYYGLLEITGRTYDEDELIRNCLLIEPTDSIIFNKATIFDYKEGRVKEKIGEHLKFTVLCFVGNNIIDTVEFNKCSIKSLSSVDDIIEELKYAVKKKDLKKLAEVSTESIIRNQQRLKYDILDEVLKIKKAIGGLGIIGAHSGDMLGIILEDRSINIEELNKIKIVGYDSFIIESIGKTKI